MKTRLLILATIAVASIIFPNNASALEIKTYKDHSDNPDYGLFKRDVEIIIHEKEEITDEKVSIIINEIFKPKDTSLTPDYNYLKNLHGGVIEICAKEMQNTTDAENCPFRENDEYQLDLMPLSDAYKNFSEWYRSKYDEQTEHVDLRYCDPRPIEESGCSTAIVKISIDRTPTPQDEENKNPPQDNSLNQNQEQPKEGIQSQSQISAPNTGAQANSIVAILSTITLLGSATFAFRHKK